MAIGFFLIHAASYPTFSIPDLPGTVEIKLPRRLNDEEFYTFCVEHPDLRIEQDRNGKLIIMPPCGFDSGYYESEVSGELRDWRKNISMSGKTLSATTGFKLPDGSTHSADGAWVSAEKEALLTPEQRKKFAPVVPDFVMEIRSESDRLNKLQHKMQQVWMRNGVRLAWLIDPIERKAYIYRQGKPMETVPDFERTLSGEDVCVGFELDLRILTS